MKYKIRKDLLIGHYGRTLYRIEALKDFGDIKKGNLGGYVEEESNLSQYGNCWIYDDAKVYEDSTVFENAKVSDSAEVFGNAYIKYNTKINNNIEIYSNKDYKFIQGPKHDITVTLQGINIGCKYYKDYEEYLEKSPKDGKDNYYTELDMKYLKCLIKNTLKFIKLDKRLK